MKIVLRSLLIVGKKKPSNFGRKQENRSKRGNRHEQKQQLNDMIYKKRDNYDNCD